MAKTAKPPRTTHLLPCKGALQHIQTGRQTYALPPYRAPPRHGAPPYKAPLYPAPGMRSPNTGDSVIARGAALHHKANQRAVF